MWYWFSFRSKVNFFHVSNEISQAFANRFLYLLICLDEIGFQFYTGIKDRNNINKIFYFNYFITLLTGIFDSLALRFAIESDIYKNFGECPSKISLNKKSGKYFLDILRTKNIKIRKLISEYANFINLIYEIRHKVIHSEMFSEVKLNIDRDDEKLIMHALKIEDNIIKYFKLIKDKKNKYDDRSIWGIYKVYDYFYLEPFYFSKTASEVIIKFSNEYLELMGYDNFLNDAVNNKHRDFIKTINSFKDYSLDLELKL